MDGALISKLIYTHCPKLAHLFAGCFPCDSFPPIRPGDMQFQIVNTDPHDETGRHWVLIGRRVGAKLFYFDSLDPPKNIPYTCVRNRLSSFYGKTFTSPEAEAIIRPINIGLVAQSKNTDTCGLYCIYAAHVIYLAGVDEEFRGNDGAAWVDEDGVLQFAHEHFGGHTFVKRVLYL
jgi:hypothetical protein